MQNFRVDHVHIMFFVLISFAFGGQRKPSFQWNMGFTFTIVNHYNSTETSNVILELLCKHSVKVLRWTLGDYSGALHNSTEQHSLLLYSTGYSHYLK